MDINEQPNPAGNPSRELVPAGQGPAVSYDRVLAPHDPFGPHGAFPPAGHGKAFSVGRILRFKWTIVLTFIVLAIPAVAAVWLFTVPKYTAKGEIRVRPLVRPLVFKTEDNGVIPFYQSYLNTQVAIVRRPELLQKVLDQKDVQGTRWYKEQLADQNNAAGQSWYGRLLGLLTGDSSRPVERLLKELSVSPRGPTEIIDVAMTTDDGKDSAIIVNAVLDQYLADAHRLDAETDRVYRDKLVEEETTLRAEIESREKEVAELRKELGTATPEELITQMRLRLDVAEARLVSLRQDLAAAEWEEQDLWRAVRQDPIAGAYLYERLASTLRVLSGEIQALERTRPEQAAPAAAPEVVAKQPGPSPDSKDALTRAGTTETQQLKDLQQEYAAVEARQKELAVFAKIADEQTDDSDDSDVAPATAQPLDRPSYHEDPEWRQLNTEFQAASRDVVVSRQRLTEKHPQMAAIKKRMEFAEQLLHEREQQLDEQWKTRMSRLPAAAPIPMPMPMPSTAAAGADRSAGQGQDIVTRLQNTRQRVRLLKYQEGLLLDTVAKEQATFDRLFGKAQTLAKSTEAIRYKRDLYGAVRTRLEQKEMERNVPGAIDVMTRAIAPSEPTSDRRILLSVMALVGALSAGIGLAFLRSSTGQHIHEPEDLQGATAAPFLGYLPLVPAKARAVPEDHPGLAESFRMVRTALLQRMDLEQGNTVQITSAEPGAGKSTVAVMLGKSLAQGGKRVLLVDADLRNPALSELFNVPLEPGFIGTLSGQAPDSEAIIETDTPRLSVLPAGRAHGNDPELMVNGAFSTCLERWRRQYDLVLLDGSPLLLVADAGILAQKASGTIMVVRERASRRREVVAALDRLKMCGGDLLGVIFIGSGEHAGYGYGYHGSYYGGKTNDRY